MANEQKPRKQGMDPRLLRRVRRRDRLATGIITAGGVFVIVAVLGILVLIARVAIPLFGAPELTRTSGFDLPSLPADTRPIALGVDEYRESIYLLDDRGGIGFLRAADGKPLERTEIERPTPGARRVVHLNRHGRDRFGLLWNDGSLTRVRLDFRPDFDGEGRRTLVRSVRVEAQLPPPAGSVPRLGMARLQGEEGWTRADVLDGNRLLVTRRKVTESLLGDKAVEDVSAELEAPPSGQITHLLMDATGETLIAGTDAGYLLRFRIADLEEPELTDRIPAVAEGNQVTALAWLQGEFTVALGDETGALSGWFPVRNSQDDAMHLTRVHHLESSEAAVQAVLPSTRTKTVVRIDTGGRILIDHFTTGRTLLHAGGERPIVLAGLNRRANALATLDGANHVRVMALEMPHPEVSTGAYFDKIWYESYPEPAYVWQSSAASDEFEPKLSLIPLIFGTLKATFYGMLFAAPLAVFGALYTSSMMHPALRRFIKPAFEIMGAVPTVVIGFLAALWLAPILDSSLTAFLLTLGFLPLTAIGSMALADRLPGLGPWQRRLRGNEFLVAVPMVLVAVVLAFLAGQALDTVLFGGGMPRFLSETHGVSYDQRNSIVIAMALGFAVLPTIFTISDDALANVPRHLTAASLALGASRWQTVWRVILPSASPGIFAALMVGLGRAVGETMIVLMATGNTPIMDLSPLNGMRTLSANIAVEIPEAPHDGTLYRTLFLSAVLLFITTFVLNSAAEVVRQRLRRKFGQY